MYVLSIIYVVLLNVTAFIFPVNIKVYHIQQIPETTSPFYVESTPGICPILARRPTLMILLPGDLLCSPAPDHTQTLFKLYLSVNKMFPVLLPVPVEPIKELQTFPSKEM